MASIRSGGNIRAMGRLNAEEEIKKPLGPTAYADAMTNPASATPSR
jgi:hypothetical protein